MSLMFGKGSSLSRWWSATSFLALAIVAGGCGSSDQSGQPRSASGKSLEDRVNPNDLYRYEGKGKAKKKVEVSRRERVKLLHEAANKAE